MAAGGVLAGVAKNRGVSADPAVEGVSNPLPSRCGLY